MQIQKVNQQMQVEVLTPGGVPASVSISPDACVSDLKTKAAFALEIGAQVHLAFAGRVLADSDRIADAGITNGSRIYAVPIPSRVTLKVIAKGREKPVEIEVFRSDTAFSLQLLVAHELQAHPEKVTLVWNGRVLEGEFSIDHYGVPDGAVVRAVVRTVASKPSPTRLIDALYQKVSQLLSAPPRRCNVILEEISQLIENSVLQAYANVDSDARHLVDDALMILESAEIPMAYDASETVAAMNDLTMTLFEETLEGMRVLQDLLLTDTSEKPILEFPTTIPFERQISETPLPTWWCNGCPLTLGEEARRVSAQVRYRREIMALKKLGIKDESEILRALKETSGNLPLAARLLVRKTEHKI